ncbi:hypothetical protein RJ639_014010 [Escallonia herrerae]|uniref:PPM-type phosphatase domain-containing protein n=1 Tax=Escallonia herrerae TaxID=1293975 RepID=A0AA88VI26_9ASTE|nr:hypothetical protein RJ639_014010 [Escallonia herrerae]
MLTWPWKYRKLKAEELSRDHHPDRANERAQIEAAGGFVKVWGLPGINGLIAVSRAVGDVHLRTETINSSRSGHNDKPCVKEIQAFANSIP